MNLLIPFLILLLLVLIVNHLLKRDWRRQAEKKALSALRPLSLSEKTEALQKYGSNSNSFLTLYPGFEYFTSKNPQIQGFIPFVITQSGWVAAAEPLVAPEHQVEIMREFAAAAESAGKVVVMLPVTEATALLAAQADYHSFMIGCEPALYADQYPPKGKSWDDINAATKQLANKGAVVTEFRPEEISSEERADLDQIIKLWLESRKMEPLAFLNHVDPWRYSEHKRYFKIEIGRKVLAFIAAIPIMNKQGWYLLDVMRRPDILSGTTETLMLQSVKILFATGAREVSLGMAPLSQLEKVSDHPAAKAAHNAGLYKFFHWLHDKGQWFYSFSSLYQYKMKFKPSATPACFAIIKTRQYKNRYLEILRVSNSIFQAMMPKRFALATLLSLIRILRQYSLGDWLRGQLRSTVIVRSTPPSWARLLQRCKFTVTILMVNILIFFLTTDGEGRIHPALEQGWGFSWTSFTEHPLQSLLLSPFLHWSTAHLCWNLFIITLFTGATEYLAGTPITFATYLITTLLTNPITAGVLGYPMRFFFPMINPGEIDIGASLGCVATAGALFWFLRHRWALILIIVGASLLNIWLTHSFMPFNHIVAFGLGMLISWVALNRVSTTP